MRACFELKSFYQQNVFFVFSFKLKSFSTFLEFQQRQANKGSKQTKEQKNKRVKPPEMEINNVDFEKHRKKSSSVVVHLCNPDKEKAT
jgi:hypothetical protein